MIRFLFHWTVRGMLCFNILWQLFNQREFVLMCRWQRWVSVEEMPWLSVLLRRWRCRSGDHCLCVGLLQAERAVVRKRMAVVVFDQSWQSGEDHFIVQKNVVHLSKHKHKVNRRFYYYVVKVTSLLCLISTHKWIIISFTYIAKIQ